MKARAAVRLPVAVHSPAGRVVQFRAAKIAAAGQSSGDQHLAVGQQRRRVQSRAVARLPVAVQVPLAGSYSSALLRKPPYTIPPATSTLPLGSNVAV